MDPSPVPLSPTDHWAPERIKALRKSLGLSQRKLGRLVGTSQDAVSNWECGENHPGIDTINRLRLLTPESVRCLERFTPPPPDLVVSLHRLAEAFGFTITIPAKADKRWLMAELARLTALRTRLYGQVR